RPLAYVQEKDLVAYAELKQFPIIPCNLCGSQENLKRKEVSRMIADWDKRFPGRSWSVFGALSRVVPSHLMDRDLFDFMNLQVDGRPDPSGDIAFDSEDFNAPLTAIEEEIDEADAAEEVRRPRVIPVKAVQD